MKCRRFDLGDGRRSGEGMTSGSLDTRMSSSPRRGFDNGQSKQFRQETSYLSKLKMHEIS